MDKIKNFVKAYYKYIIFFVCIMGFLALAEDVFNKDLMEGDIIGYRLVSEYLISDNMTAVVKVVTQFGSAFALIGITILILVFVKDKNIGKLTALNLIIITILNRVFKFILQRPRPVGYNIITATGYSFPSGHSMISAGFYGFLIYLVYKNIKNKKLKIFLIVFLTALILCIGISRIYLGVHYTSDVLAGFLVSAAYLTVYIPLADKVLKNNPIHKIKVI